MPASGGADPPPLPCVGQLTLELDVPQIDLKYGKAVVGAEADGVDNVGEIEENLKAQTAPDLRGRMHVRL